MAPSHRRCFIIKLDPWGPDCPSIYTIIEIILRRSLSLSLTTPPDTGCTVYCTVPHQPLAHEPLVTPDAMANGPSWTRLHNTAADQMAWSIRPGSPRLPCPVQPAVYTRITKVPGACEAFSNQFSMYIVDAKELWTALHTALRIGSFGFEVIPLSFPMHACTKWSCNTHTLLSTSSETFCVCQG